MYFFPLDESVRGMILRGREIFGGRNEDRRREQRKRDEKKGAEGCAISSRMYATHVIPRNVYAREKPPVSPFWK